MQNTSLSVVVIGRNEGERLVRCLESVAAMWLGTLPEVIYVDSASSDGSTERAARLGARVISVDPDRPSAAVGRNAGWRAARGNIVMFLDGDMTIAPNFIEETVGDFCDPKVGVIFGDCRESDPSASIYNRILDLDWIAPVGPVEYCGGAALIRRELLERVGGYNESLIAAEDTELCSRIRGLGYTVLHVDRLMVRHDLAITRFSQYWRRAMRSGYAYAEVSGQIRQTDLPMWYRQARRNRIQGAAMLAMLVGAPIVAVATQSMLPVWVVIAFIAWLAARTAIRSQWKKAPLLTRFAHGLHSHFIQIPLLLGQIRFQFDRAAGRTTSAIEYKDGGAPVSGKVKSAR